MRLFMQQRTTWNQATLIISGLLHIFTTPYFTAQQTQL